MIVKAEGAALAFNINKQSKHAAVWAAQWSYPLVTAPRAGRAYQVPSSHTMQGHSYSSIDFE